jgi:alpha-galactosidase
MVWTSHAGPAGDWYVALFNIADSAHAVSITTALLGLKGKIAVRDLWKKADPGAFKGSFTQTIQPHGALLLRMTGK